MMRQSVAIPYRVAQDRLEILLVTSLRRKRWILPKGKVKTGMMPGRSAENEAFEEAGVLGRMSKDPIGSYRQNEAGIADSVTVQAFSLEVVTELPVWQEMHKRKRKWFTVKDALKAVRDQEISDALRSFERAMTK